MTLGHENKKIDDIYSAMFAAASNEISFYPVLNMVIEYFGAAAGVIFELNRKTGEISNWTGPGLEPGEQEYAEKLNAINPRMRYSLSHAAGHVCYEYLFTDEEKMDNSEFYQAIERLSGVRYFLGSRMYDVGDVSVFHSIEFTRQHGHPDKTKIEAFRSMAKNIGQAWKISRTAAVKSSNRQSQLLYDCLPWAVFSASSDGAIQPQNGGAMKLTAPKGSFELHEGQLQVNDSSVNKAIARLVKQALSGSAGAMKLPDTVNSAQSILQVIPVPDISGAMLFIRDTGQSFDYFEKVLPHLFGMTAIEVDIIKLLARGNDLSAVAADLERSRNTVRNHLQKIYGKTGASNRAELLIQVLGLVKPLN